VRERVPLPFAAGADAAWPPVAAFAVTRAKPDGSVHLESTQGDPLLASWQAGLGRVAVVTSGLGMWAPAWLEWSPWPVIAGGLVEWVGRGSARSIDLSVNVADHADQLRVEVETGSAAAWNTPLDARLLVRTPSGAEYDLALESTAPGRAAAVVPAAETGLYALTVITPDGSRALRHLRATRPELGPVEPSAEIDAWQRVGLVREWSAAELRGVIEEVAVSRGSSSQALLLALLLFLLGVGTERLRPPAMGGSSLH
jgi:hypothetical protein